MLPVIECSNMNNSRSSLPIAVFRFRWRGMKKKALEEKKRGNWTKTEQKNVINFQQQQHSKQTTRISHIHIFALTHLRHTSDVDKASQKVSQNVFCTLTERERERERERFDYSKMGFPFLFYFSLLPSSDRQSKELLLNGKNGKNQRPAEYCQNQICQLSKHLLLPMHFSKYPLAATTMQHRHRNILRHQAEQT